MRRAVLALLNTAEDVVAHTPRIYPMQRPPNAVWPFIAYGAPITVPFIGSCLDGETVSVAIHSYAETMTADGVTTPGEDKACEMNAAVVAALGGEDGAEVVLETPYPAKAYISWTGSQVMQDGSDAGAFHGIATFDITVSS